MLFLSSNNKYTRWSGSLSACYSYLAAIQTLVENDSHRPHIHLVGDFGWLLSNHKALRGQVPKVEKTVLVDDIIFPTDGQIPILDYWTLPHSSPRTSCGVPVQNMFLKYQCAIIIKFFTAKPFTQPRPINCSLLSPLVEIAFTQQNKRFVFLKILAAAAAGQASPVCPCSLWRQLHPIYGVIAVIVHDLWQAKVCDLDLSTGGAIHQQDVTLAIKCISGMDGGERKSISQL